LIGHKSLLAFLTRHAARLGLRPQGYPRVARQVGRRLWARCAALNLPDLGSYEKYLARHPEEWGYLDEMCRITISRLYRDGRVFDYLSGVVLPLLSQAAVDRAAPALRLWSAGCASGEEPATLALIWVVRLAPRFPQLSCRILATDLGEPVLERARQGGYGKSSLVELPADLRAALVPAGPLSCLPDSCRQIITIQKHDVRETPPWHGLDMVLCRNLAFTYFSPAVQGRVLTHFDAALLPEGVLVTGAKELLASDARSGQARWSSRSAGVWGRG
jgi:chemotaxis protein methyltransferase CheR